jgi:asparagine synthase (glutamine-hydrolysing)
MCGIVGVVSLNKQRQNITEESIRGMTSVIKHRGPDDCGIYRRDGVALGMRRLSIIDIQGGHQPISNEDSSIHIVCNGEIYNHLELKRVLEMKGHFYRTNSDIETILHLYEEYDEKCVEYLNGMFAIAIWDERRRKLLLSRDRIGIKPLYYGKFDDLFLFGSEIKAILEYPRFPRRLNDQIISAYLTLLYIPTPYSIFKDIYKLPPAHILVLENGKIKIWRYWKLPKGPVKGLKSSFNIKEYIQEISNRMEISVRRRLMSEVPLGAFLSGGVDSSTVVSLMSQSINNSVKSFTIDFKGGGKKYSEVEFARQVAKHCRTDHHEHTVHSLDLVDLLKKLAWHFDEPFADSSMVPAFIISKIAREYITVALTGDGGDELFGGYDNYKHNKVFEYFKRMPHSVVLRLVPWLFKKLANSAVLRGKILSYRLLRFNELLPLSPLERHIDLMSFFKSEDYQSILSKDNMTEWNAYKDIYEPIWNEKSDEDIWNRIFKLDLQSYLPEDILTKVDRTSMANSLEARVPMLDHELVEYVLSLPAEFKLRGLQTKYILKRIASTLIPHSVIHRRKQGFSVPINEWLRGDLHEFCHDLLLGNSRNCSGIFRKSAVENILQKHARHERNLGHHIWALMIFELWHSTFI